MKKVIGIIILMASSFGVYAEARLSCDLDEIDSYTGEVARNADVKVTVPDRHFRDKRVSEYNEDYVIYEEWVINPQASIYRLRGKLDGELVTLEKSMIEAGTGIVRGEIRHKEMGSRPRKNTTYEGRCYLDE